MSTQATAPVQTYPLAHSSPDNDPAVVRSLGRANSDPAALSRAPGRSSPPLALTRAPAVRAKPRP